MSNRVAKGTNYRAHFTHIDNGFTHTVLRATNRYHNLGFRTFRKGVAPLTTVTITTPNLPARA